MHSLAHAVPCGSSRLDRGETPADTELPANGPDRHHEPNSAVPATSFVGGFPEWLTPMTYADTVSSTADVANASLPLAMATRASDRLPLTPGYCGGDGGGPFDGLHFDSDLMAGLSPLPDASVAGTEGSSSRPVVSFVESSAAASTADLLALLGALSGSALARVGAAVAAAAAAATPASADARDNDAAGGSPQPSGLRQRHALEPHLLHGSSGGGDASALPPPVLHAPATAAHTARGGASCCGGGVARQCSSRLVSDAQAQAVAAGGFMAWASSFRAEADAAARDLEAAHASSHQHPPPHLSPHAKRARGDANRDAAGHILAPASQQLQQQSANAHSNAAAAINNTGDPQCLQATGYNNGGNGSGFQPHMLTTHVCHSRQQQQQQQPAAAAAPAEAPQRAPHLNLMLAPPQSQPQHSAGAAGNGAGGGSMGFACHGSGAGGGSPCRGSPRSPTQPCRPTWPLHASAPPPPAAGAGAHGGKPPSFGRASIAAGSLLQLCGSQQQQQCRPVSSLVGVPAVADSTAAVGAHMAAAAVAGGLLYASSNTNGGHAAAAAGGARRRSSDGGASRCVAATGGGDSGSGLLLPSPAVAHGAGNNDMPHELPAAYPADSRRGNGGALSGTGLPMLAAATAAAAPSSSFNPPAELMSPPLPSPPTDAAAYTRSPFDRRASYGAMSTGARPASGGGSSSLSAAAAAAAGLRFGKRGYDLLTMSGGGPASAPAGPPAPPPPQAAAAIMPGMRAAAAAGVSVGSCRSGPPSASVATSAAPAAAAASGGLLQHLMRQLRSTARDLHESQEEYEQRQQLSSAALMLMEEGERRRQQRRRQQPPAPPPQDYRQCQQPQLHHAPPQPRPAASPIIHDHSSRPARQTHLLPQPQQPQQRSQRHTQQHTQHIWQQSCVADQHLQQQLHQPSPQQQKVQAHQRAGTPLLPTLLACVSSDSGSRASSSPFELSAFRLRHQQPGVAGGSGGHLSDNVSGGRVSGIAGVGNALDLLANLATVKLEVLQQQECQGQAVGPVLDAPPALLQQQRRQRSPRPPPHSAPPRQLSQPHHQPPAAAPWSDSSPVVARLAALVEEAEAMASLQQSEPPPQPHRYELQGQQLEHRALQRLRVPRRQWSFPLAAQGPAPPPPGSKDVVAATSANTIYPSTPLPDEASSEDSYPSEWSAGPLPPHAVVERREAPRDEVLSSMEQLRRSRERRKAQLAEANTAAKQRHAAGSDFVRAAAVAALIDPVGSYTNGTARVAAATAAAAAARAAEPYGSVTRYAAASGGAGAATAAAAAAAACRAGNAGDGGGMREPPMPPSLQPVLQALSRLLPAGGDEGEAAVGLGASATAGAVEPWGAPRTRTTPGYAQQPCAHPGSAADAAAADELGWRAHAGVEKDPLIGPPPNKRARGGQEW